MWQRIADSETSPRSRELSIVLSEPVQDTGDASTRPDSAVSPREALQSRRHRILLTSDEVALTRGDATREKLLKAAIGLFHEFGYNRTSVQDIVSRAKIPKGSFYNYFKSKEELAIAVSDVFYPYALAFLELENFTCGPASQILPPDIKRDATVRICARLSGGQLCFRNYECDPSSQRTCH